MFVSNLLKTLLWLSNCRTPIKVLVLYFNLCLSVKLHCLLCSFIFISFFINWLIWFFGVKSWFFTRNTQNIFAPPSTRRNFFKCAPLNLKSGIRPCSVSDYKLIIGSDYHQLPNNSSYHNITKEVKVHCISEQEMRGDCLICWYWWNCWPTLFKLSFYNERNSISDSGQNQNSQCMAKKTFELQVSCGTCPFFLTNSKISMKIF